MKKVLVLMMALCVLLPGLASATDGELIQKIWWGIGGGNVSDLTGHVDYPDNWTETAEDRGWDWSLGFDVERDLGSQFGTTIEGYITAPVTGNYVFYIATDDGGELWLSTEGNGDYYATDPAQATMVAATNGWAGYKQWDNTDNVVPSVPIALEEGGKYYVYALMKEDGGGDHTTVGWVIDGATTYPTDSIAQEYISSDPYAPWKATGVTPPADGSVGQGLITWGEPTWNTPTPIVQYNVHMSTDEAQVSDPANSAATFKGSVAAGADLELLLDVAKNTIYYVRVDTALADSATDPNNAFGDVKSFAGEWTMPVITGHPSGTWVISGEEDATFSVEATVAEGHPVTSCQWYGPAGLLQTTADIADLTVPGAVDADAGDYYAVLTNDDGSTTSGTGTLGITHLIGHWTFDEGIGPAALDSSPDGAVNDATIMWGQGPHTDPNSVWSPDGIAGGCVDLNSGTDHGGGNGSWLDVGKLAAELDLDGNKSKSVSVWAYAKSFSNGGIWDLGRRSDGQNWSLRTLGANHRWRVQYWGGDHTFQTTNWTQGQDMNARPGDEFEFPSMDVWVHWVLTHGPEGTKVYANGHLIVDWAGKTIDTGDQMTFRIGQYGPNHDKWNGLIDEFRLYKGVLTQQHVWELYAEVKPDDPICKNDDYPVMDLSRDCKVGIEDLAIFLEEYMHSSTVPERHTKPY